MKARSIKSLLIILGIIGILPIGLYVAYFLRVPTLSAEEGIEIINNSGESAVLIDVRPSEDFQERHILGAISWPLADILKIGNADKIPKQLVGRYLLFICEAGVSSIKAVQHLQSIGMQNLYNVRGGIQAWILASAEPVKFVDNEGPYSFQSTSFRQMTFIEQLGGTLSGLVFKPIYMVMSLLLGIILAVQLAFDLRIMGWSLIVFFIGEAFCAVNYLIYDHNAYLPEYFHSYGMVFAFGLAIYSLMKGLDDRIINYSSLNKRCSFLPLCGDCIKINRVNCRGRVFFLYLIPAIVLLSVVPIFSHPNNTAYSTNIFLTRNNYAHLMIFQYFETRFLPVITIILLSIGFFIILRAKSWPVPESALKLSAISLGALGFGIFRLLFNSIYQENLVWASFWEETTELIFVLVVLCILIIFQKSLFRDGRVNVFPKLIR